MPGSFRRAQLRGSDELFRPTRPGEDAGAAGNSAEARLREPAASAPHSEESLGVQRPDGRLIRFSDEEVEILVEAVQRLKYPTATKVPTKPPMELYERLEELRQKLIAYR